MLWRAALQPTVSAFASGGRPTGEGEDRSICSQAAPAQPDSWVPSAAASQRGLRCKKALLGPVKSARSKQASLPGRARPTGWSRAQDSPCSLPLPPPLPSTDPSPPKPEQWIPPARAARLTPFILSPPLPRRGFCESVYFRVCVHSSASLYHQHGPPEKGAALFQPCSAPHHLPPAPGDYRVHSGAHGLPQSLVPSSGVVGRHREEIPVIGHG